jgi:3-deoxy-D-manno-octulosonic-acid transferase
LVIILIFLIPFLIIQILKGKYREGFAQRLGFIPEDILKKLKGKKIIWVHAVSVGETVAASPVVKKIKEAYPDYSILFSTVTDTGQEMARKIIEDADAYIYFPLDLSFMVGRVLRLINPLLIIIMETELWPNFIRKASKSGAKIVYANGRISDQSVGRYKYLGPFLEDMLKRIDLFCMQSEQDLSYILKLGADPAKVHNTGNTKLDQDYTGISPEEKNSYLEEFKIRDEDKVLVVGSTHANEEEQFASIYKELKDEFEDFIMILAPRHITRIDEIEEMFHQAGIKTIRRTGVRKRKDEPVILVDTIGELGKLYSLGDLAFVGGSLVESGGHNILEPAVHGKLVFFGPHVYDFKESSQLLLENEAGIQVQDKEELVLMLKKFLHNPSLMEKYSRNARAVIEKNRGTTDRIVMLLKKLEGGKERSFIEGGL